MWGTETEGLDCGDEAGQWFSDYLLKPGVRLVQHVDGCKMRPSSIELKSGVTVDAKQQVIKHVLLLNKQPVINCQAWFC